MEAALAPPTMLHRIGTSRGAVDTVIRCVDLFAGAGGLSLGFEHANKWLSSVRYEPVLAVEHDNAAARTYKANFGATVIDTDIRLVDPAIYPPADLVLGGPPCQGFSPLGRDRDPSSRAALNSLWTHYLDAIATIRPLGFVVENVPQFLTSPSFAELRHRMVTDSALSQYRYSYSVLNAADYGVPQRRRRAILCAVRGVDVPWPPPPTHGAAAGIAHRTVRDAIGDLPAHPTSDVPVTRGGVQDLHIRRHPRSTSLERYRAIPEGGNRFDLQAARPDLTPACWANKPSGTTDVMGRLWWDRPAVTIRTEFFKPEKGRFLHPTQHRPITHREAARLQTFPDSFTFEGTKVEIARQIGNAVPPLLAERIAIHMSESILVARDRELR